MTTSLSRASPPWDGGGRRVALRCDRSGGLDRTTVAVAFLSGVMAFGDMPVWADRIAAVFPVKPFNDALHQQFNPYGTGAGWDLEVLVVITVWGVGAAAVATRSFRWDPAVSRSARGQASRGGGVRSTPQRANVRHGPRGEQPTPRARTDGLLEQVRWANRGHPTVTPGVHVLRRGHAADALRVHDLGLRP